MLGALLGKSEAHFQSWPVLCPSTRSQPRPPHGTGPVGGQGPAGALRGRCSTAASTFFGWLGLGVLLSG